MDSALDDGRTARRTGCGVPSLPHDTAHPIALQPKRACAQRASAPEIDVRNTTTSRIFAMMNEILVSPTASGVKLNGDPPKGHPNQQLSLRR